MTYIGVLTAANVLEALQAWLVGRVFSYRTRFFGHGLSRLHVLAYNLSSFLRILVLP